MSWLFGLVEYLSTFVEVYIILCVFGLFFEKRNKKFKHIFLKICFSIGITVFTKWLNNFGLYSYLTATIWMFLVAIIALILYKSNYIKAVCIAVVYLVLINALDFLSLSIIELIFNFKGVTLEVMSSVGLLRSIWLVFVKTISVIIYLFLARRTGLYKMFDVKNCFTVIASGIFCFFCMQYLIEAVIVGNVVDMRRAVLIAWLFIFLFIISFILILRGNMRFASERMTSSIIATRLEILEKDNKSLNDAYGEIAKLTHDFRNHMRTMTMLAQNSKYDELTDYLKQVSVDVDNVQIVSYTGVESIDAVINNKKTVAEKQGIVFEIDAAPLCGIHIRSMDLCAVIVNMLDNAIEANLQLPDCSVKNIRLSISTIHSMIVIKTENTFDVSHVSEFSSGEIMSTKSNRNLHGYGLRIVKTIAEKYNGSFETKFTNEQFVSVVMLMNDN